MPEYQNNGEDLRIRQDLNDMQALVRVISEVNSSRDLQQILRAGVEGIRQVMGGEFGGVILVRPNAKAELAHNTALPSALLAALEDLTLRPEVSQFSGSPEESMSILSLVGEQVGRILREHGIGFVIMPLTARDHAAGVLFVGAPAKKLLYPQSVNLLMSIGEQVGRALENARLHAQLRDSEEWYRTFIENSLAGFLEGDAEGRILFVNDGACQIFGMTREVLLSKRTRDLFVTDEETTRAREKTLSATGVLTNSHGYLRAADNQVKDMSSTTRAVHDSDGNLIRFQTVFHDITEQQRLLEAIQERNQELAVLNAIAGILSNPLETDRALDQICEQIISITRMESVGIYLIDESRKFLNLLAHRGIPASLQTPALRLGLNDPATYTVAVEGKTIALNDVADFDGADSFAGPRAEGYHAGIGVPIHQRGTPVGAIYVGSKKTRYDQSDVNLLLGIGNQIGVALENAALFSQMQQRVSELNGLAELSAACVSTLDPHTLSEIAVDWTRRLLRADGCGIRLLEGETLRLGAARLVDATGRAEEQIEMDPVMRSVVVDRMHSAVNDAETDLSLSPKQRERMKASGTRAAVGVPLPTRERVIGILTVGYREPHVWSEREIELLKTIANQVANAIDNAQLFQRVSSEQRKVQAIFDSGLSGLFATDAAGRIAMFNRAAERITGWTFDQVCGKKWTDLFTVETADAPIVSPIMNALTQKQPTFEQDGYFIKTKDERVIPVAKAAAPLLDDQGNVVGAVGAFWDLTKEKAAEVEREDFLRMVAHEIRSPLTAMLSALQLLERPNLPLQSRTTAWEILRTHGERLKKFAGQFLDHESAYKPDKTLNLEPLDIVSFAHTLARRIISDKGTHTFEIKSSKPKPLVYADPDLIELALRNLMDNAVSYSPAGTIITITVKGLEGWVDLAVRDRGSGIPLSEQEKIFRPFYRVARKEASPLYGHGLGLWIAQNNATAMGGRITVDSQEERGTTFHLILRRYQ